tara:strand:+ start:301 stop:1416 length:1116 start_codon:yes stop_codon:yes gene_type:complete
MKFSLFLVVILVTAASCQTKKNKNSLKENMYPFFLGTYTSENSEGIYHYILEPNGKITQKKLMAKADNPSFLAMSSDEKYLVTVNELQDGTVSSYSITEDSLKLESKTPSGGAHPCFVAIDEDNDVLIANYTGGNVGLLKLKNNGKLTDLLFLEEHEGKGTNTARQEGPHAHSVWFVPDEKKEIVSADLGTNELWFAQLNKESQKLDPSEIQKLEMPDGSGPRHLTFHPNGKWIYVLNELNGTITKVVKNEKSYSTAESVSILPKDFNAENTTADIHISSDGKFVYASNRGHNSIAILKVNEDDGSIKLIANESTRGETPRNFALSPDDNYLIVANQKTNNLVSFERNAETGLLEFVSETEAPTPVCILFY